MKPTEKMFKQVLKELGIRKPRVIDLVDFMVEFTELQEAVAITCKLKDKEFERKIAKRVMEYEKDLIEKAVKRKDEENYKKFLKECEFMTEEQWAEKYWFIKLSTLTQNIEKMPTAKDIAKKEGIALLGCWRDSDIIRKTDVIKIIKKLEDGK